jgi:Rod binding domain-containing protein
MDPRAIDRLTLHPVDATAQQRQHAERVAGQFEELFVRTLVQSLRESATVGGSSGMFGDGPGASTYADWFDQNVAEQLASARGIGVKRTLIAEFERWGQLSKADPAAAGAAATTAKARIAAATLAAGGFDGAP